MLAARYAEPAADVSDLAPGLPMPSVDQGGKISVAKHVALGIHLVQGVSHA